MSERPSRGPRPYYGPVVGSEDDSNNGNDSIDDIDEECGGGTVFDVLEEGSTTSLGTPTSNEGVEHDEQAVFPALDEAERAEQYRDDDEEEIETTNEEEYVAEPAAAVEEDDDDEEEIETTNATSSTGRPSRRSSKKKAIDYALDNSSEEEVVTKKKKTTYNRKKKKTDDDESDFISMDIDDEEESGLGVSSSSRRQPVTHGSGSLAARAARSRADRRSGSVTTRGGSASMVDGNFTRQEDNDPRYWIEKFLPSTKITNNEETRLKCSHSGCLNSFCMLPMEKK